MARQISVEKDIEILILDFRCQPYEPEILRTMSERNHERITIISLYPSPTSNYPFLANSVLYLEDAASTEAYVFASEYGCNRDEFGQAPRMGLILFEQLS